MDKLGPIIEDAAKKRHRNLRKWKIHELLQRSVCHFQVHKRIMSKVRRRILRQGTKRKKKNAGRLGCSLWLRGGMGTDYSAGPSPPPPER